MEKQNKSFNKFIASLVQEGRNSFFFNEALAYHEGTKVAAQLALYRLLKAKKLFSPKHDFFVIVPLEHQGKGSVPSLWYIDAYMQMIDKNYYLCLLSAAALEGASHQQSPVLQVMSQKQIAPVVKNDTHINFYKTSMYDERFIRLHKTPYGYVKASMPELTLLDLFKFPYAAGYLNNTATIMSELYGAINAKRLEHVLDVCAKVTYVQRMGYMSEVLQCHKITTVCTDYLSKQKRLQLTPLNQYMPDADVKIDNRWKIIINDTIETDI